MIGAGRIELRTVISPRKAELAERSGRPALLQPASKLRNLKSFRENQRFGRTTMSAHVDSGPRMPPIASALLGIGAAFNLPGAAGPRWWLGLSGVVSILA